MDNLSTCGYICQCLSKLPDEFSEVTLQIHMFRSHSLVFDVWVVADAKNAL